MACQRRLHVGVRGRSNAALIWPRKPNTSSSKVAAVVSAPHTSSRVETDGHERPTRPTEIRADSGVGNVLWPPFEIWDSKLHPPIPRAEIVERKVLVRRLRASAAPFLSIVAPPGYGKTTLLSQWAEASDSPVAWVSVDERDNDPSVLLAHVATAINRIEPLDNGFLRLVTSPRSGAALRAVHRLASTFSDIVRAGELGPRPM